MFLDTPDSSVVSPDPSVVLRGPLVMSTDSLAVSTDSLVVSSGPLVASTDSSVVSPSHSDVSTDHPVESAVLNIKGTNSPIDHLGWYNLYWGQTQCTDGWMIFHAKFISTYTCYHLSTQ